MNPSTRRVVFFVVVAVALGGHGVRAACPSPGRISSFDTVTKELSYVYTPGLGAAQFMGSTISADLDGQFWLLGFGDPATGSGIDSGTLGGLDVMYVYPNYPARIETTWAVDPGIDGCPTEAPETRCTAVLLNDLNELQEAHFALLTAAEQNSHYLFVQDSSGPITLAPVPRIDVTSSQVFPGRIELAVEMGETPAGGLYLDTDACPSDVVSGFKVYALQLPVGSSPSIDRRDWSVADGGEGPDGAPIPAGTPATVLIPPCHFDSETHLAGSLVFDSGFETTFFGGTVRIECLTCVEIDKDQDGFGVSACLPPDQFDCDDTNPRVHPGAPEVCNGIDDDCNGLIDEDENGEDSDGDLVPNLCDNCIDVDNPLQDNSDFDPRGDDCDNCPLAFNPSQTDTDADSEGDACDTDDGNLFVYHDNPSGVKWDAEEGFPTFNAYRGELAALIATGIYSQEPGSNPVAAQICGTAGTAAGDAELLDPGTVVFYLLSGVTEGGVEGSLGPDSTGVERPNHFPCPAKSGFRSLR